MATMQTTQRVPAPSLRPVAAVEHPPARNWRERLARRWGHPLLEHLSSQRRAVVAQLRAIPDRMQRVTNQARLGMEVAEDFRSGRYREISWVSIAVAAAALVYAVNPGDVVPDSLPIVGTLDDMVVLTLTMRFLEKDLKAYCRFRGYSEADYF